MTIPKRASRKILPRVSARILTGIGHVVVNWAALEDLMGVLIEQMFAKDRLTGRIIVAQMDFRHKRDVLLAALSIVPKGDPQWDKLRDLLPRIKAANDLRTVAAHSFWRPGRKRGSIKPMRFEARGAVRFKGHLDNEPNYTAALFHREADNIAALYRELSSLVDWSAIEDATKMLKTKRSISPSKAAELSK